MVILFDVKRARLKLKLRLPQFDKFWVSLCDFPSMSCIWCALLCVANLEVTSRMFEGSVGSGRLSKEVREVCICFSAWVRARNVKFNKKLVNKSDVRLEITF